MNTSPKPEMDGEQVTLVRKPRTVGERLDERIASARKEVERLCILKAKAEALNILDHEYDFYMDLALF